MIFAIAEVQHIRFARTYGDVCPGRRRVEI
jgi:hypothetical protein